MWSARLLRRYCIILHYIVLYSTVLYCTIFYCSVLYCTYPLQEEGFANAKMTAAVGGLVPKDANSGRTKKRQEKFQQMRTIVQQYNKIPLVDYIGMLSTHVNDNL